MTALEEYLKDMMEMDSLDYEPYKNIEKKIVTINIPVKFALKPAYPNPFNPVTTIPFELPEDSKVRMDVYDILGRRVVELIPQESIWTNGIYTAGYHNITLNEANLASGVYIVRAEMISMKDNSRHSFIRKVMLLK
ncbi:MAG: T9SS type A sorting domain-containing protein [Candidatus Marinimicrobia bacterium]|nr:T9SS type A sorting domain-containing protein [Candidatus Neomarinimicrobiota bacterium]